MSRISFINEEGGVVDTWNEHWCHQSYHEDCSDCYVQKVIHDDYANENRDYQMKRLYE